LLKKKQFFNIFSAGIKKKLGGRELNILGYRKSVFLSLFFCLKKATFNIFLAGIKKKVGWN